MFRGHIIDLELTLINLKKSFKKKKENPKINNVDVVCEKTVKLYRPDQAVIQSFTVRLNKRTDNKTIFFLMIPNRAPRSLYKIMWNFRTKHSTHNGDKKTRFEPYLPIELNVSTCKRSAMEFIRESHRLFYVFTFLRIVFQSSKKESNKIFSSNWNQKKIGTNRV